jgi:cold shock protein
VHDHRVSVQAQVRFWRDEEGWGVVDSASTPGGCWVHFSAIESAGYRTLDGVPVVGLEWEQAQQDGYAYRAVRVLVPGEDPTGAAEDRAGRDASGPYSSTLTLQFDDARTVVLPGNRPDSDEAPPFG